jgi:hypothetical protein
MDRKSDGCSMSNHLDKVLVSLRPLKGSTRNKQGFENV